MYFFFLHVYGARLNFLKENDYPFVNDDRFFNTEYSVYCTLDHLTCVHIAVGKKSNYF